MDALELSRGTASIGIRIIHAVLRGTILAALSETIKALSKNHPDYPIRSSAEGTQTDVPRRLLVTGLTTTARHLVFQNGTQARFERGIDYIRDTGKRASTGGALPTSHATIRLEA
jgi:hypothetical protein